MSLLIFLTGGSRGFGRCLAEQFATRCHSDGIPLDLVLFARDVDGLTGTKENVLRLHPEANVLTTKMDMNDLRNIEGIWDDTLKALPRPSPRRAILINNSGSLGPLHYIRDLTSVEELEKTIDANVTSVVWLSTLFLRFAHKLEGEHHAIINISSLAALKPFPSQLMYCTGKAARDMLHAGLAEEEGSKVKTLNYAPGPLDTDMQAELRTSDTLHADTRSFFMEMHAEKKLIDPAVSAGKCVELVISDSFLSGAHIDFYDIK